MIKRQWCKVSFHWTSSQAISLSRQPHLHPVHKSLYLNSLVRTMSLNIIMRTKMLPLILTRPPNLNPSIQIFATKEWRLKPAHLPSPTYRTRWMIMMTISHCLFSQATIFLYLPKIRTKPSHRTNLINNKSKDKI